MSKAVEEAQVHRQEVHKAWREWSLTPSGECALKDLEHYFSPPSMIKKSKDGRVDPWATHTACGAYEVISYIRSSING